MKNKAETSSKLVKFVAYVLMADILLAILTFYMVSHQPQTYYYMLSEVNGKQQISQMMPSNMPILSSEIVLNWSGVAATVAYTYDAANYQRDIDSAVSKYFTSQGGANFKQSLQTSGLLSNVIQKQMSMTSVVADQPVILKQGFLWGNYSFKVQFPILLTYEVAGQPPIPQRALVSMLVYRMPAGNKVSGLAIQQFWTQPQG